MDSFSDLIAPEFTPGEQARIEMAEQGLDFPSRRPPPDNCAEFLRLASWVPAFDDTCDRCAQRAMIRWQGLAFCKHHARELLPEDARKQCGQDRQAWLAIRA